MAGEGDVPGGEVRGREGAPAEIVRHADPGGIGDPEEVAEPDGKVGAGASIAYTAVLDDTAPEVLGAYLNLINGKTKEQVLPAFYEDNYFSLLGGGEKTVSINWLTDEHPDNKNFKPTVTIEQIR